MMLNRIELIRELDRDLSVHVVKVGRSEPVRSIKIGFLQEEK